MNQDNDNKTTALLVKVILATQILMLILFAFNSFANSRLRARYRREKSEYEKAFGDYQRLIGGYKLQTGKNEQEKAASEK